MIPMRGSVRVVAAAVLLILVQASAEAQMPKRGGVLTLERRAGYLPRSSV
jgi:hypothetical protein